MRVIIARIRSTGTAGAVVMTHHAITDAITSDSWAEDLDQLLSRQEAQIQTRTPYKMFADLYYSHRSSLEAQLGVKFHLQRLQGIDSVKDALWPPQRCPGWFIGDDSGWQPSAYQDDVGEHERKQTDLGGWRLSI